LAAYFDTKPTTAAKTLGLRTTMKQSGRFTDRQPFTGLRLGDELLEKFTLSTKLGQNIG